MRKPTFNGFLRKLGLKPWTTFSAKALRRNLLETEDGTRLDPWLDPLAGTGRTTFIAAKALFDHERSGRPIRVEVLPVWEAPGVSPARSKKNAKALTARIKELAAKAGLSPKFAKSTDAPKSTIRVTNHRP